MQRELLALGVLFCAGFAPAWAQQLKVGDHVHSTVSGYDGTVVETGGTDGYVKIVLDGHPPEHASWMSPKYWKQSGGAQQGGQAAGQGAAQGANSGPWWNPGAAGNKFKVGDRVFSEISKLSGTVTATGDPSGYVKVLLDGVTGEGSLLNPKWLKPASGAVPQANAQTPQMGAQPAGGQAGMPPNQWAAPVQNQGGQSGKSAAQVGAHVQFDRAEGSQAQFGRWDSGTVVGRDQFGRVQIRSDANGTVYNVTDNPKWIIPGGGQAPGRQHDYTDQPMPAPSKNNPAANTPNPGGGAAGPFSGEWTVVSLDGQRYEAGAQNFNFVGNRYEILNQNMTMSGHFSVNGNSVQMISDDGSPFATFQYSMSGNQMVLSGPGTQYVLVPAHK